MRYILYKEEHLILFLVNYIFAGIEFFIRLSLIFAGILQDFTAFNKNSFDFNFQGFFTGHSLPAIHWMGPHA